MFAILHLERNDFQLFMGTTTTATTLAGFFAINGYFRAVQAIVSAWSSPFNCRRSGAANGSLSFRDAKRKWSEFVWKQPFVVGVRPTRKWRQKAYTRTKVPQQKQLTVAIWSRSDCCLFGVDATCEWIELATGLKSRLLVGSWSLVLTSPYLHAHA